MLPHTKGIDYCEEYPATVQHAAPHQPLLFLAVTEPTPVP